MKSALTIAVQMDALDAPGHPHMSTFALCAEAHARGHALFHYTPDRLSFRGGRVMSTATPMKPEGKGWALGEPHALDLAETDVVLMRQDPPFDMAYISATYLLERANTLVVNNPAEVRGNPEKIFPLQFPELIPPTLVSANADDIRAFHREQGEVVLKPLYGYGGQGVFHIDAKGSNLNALLDMIFAGSPEPIMAQKFLPEVASEDRRILLIDGAFAGIAGRIPQKGDIRAGTRVGGEVVKAEATPRQRQIYETLGPVLKAKGLVLVGLDVIGGWLTEINITSPAGLKWMEDLYGANPTRDFWDAVERKL